MVQSGPLYVAYRTVTHTPPKIRKVTLPPPPALPSFDLASDDDDMDETDVAVTSERHAVRPVDERIVPKRNPDSTSEVMPEDILLEVFTDPPLKVQKPITTAMLPPPPTKAQIKDLEELLSLSVRPPPKQTPADQETPSVAPVALSVSNPSFASFQGYATELSLPPNYQAVPPARSGVVGALIAIAMVVVAGAVGVAIVKMKMPDLGMFSKLQPQKAHVLASGAVPNLHVDVKDPPKATAAPEVNVSSLPEQTIGPKITLVSMPPRAAGHRVWVDGVVVSTDGLSAVPLKCGMHNVKIMNKVSHVKFPCGEAYSLK